MQATPPSLFPSDQTNHDERLVHNRGVNLTNVANKLALAGSANSSTSTTMTAPDIHRNTTRAGDKYAPAGSANSLNATSIIARPVQHVQLDLSGPPIVQTCDNGTGAPVTQDCTCSMKQLAAQAIDDAITMVRTVKDVWRENAYGEILEQYMGWGCINPGPSGWIEGRFPI